MTTDGRIRDGGSGPAHEVAEVNRLCRALVTSLRTTTSPNMLDDESVGRTLQEIAARRQATRSAQMLGAMIVFAHERTAMAHAATGGPRMTIDSLEAWVLRESGIDPVLAKDCLAIVREMARPHRHTASLRAVIAHALGTWGLYALAAEALVYLQIVARAAADAGIEVDDLLQHWALSDELALTGSFDKPHHKRTEKE